MCLCSLSINSTTLRGSTAAPPPPPLLSMDSTSSACCHAVFIIECMCLRYVFMHVSMCWHLYAHVRGGGDFSSLRASRCKIPQSFAPLHQILHLVVFIHNHVPEKRPFSSAWDVHVDKRINRVVFFYLNTGRRGDWQKILCMCVWFRHVKGVGGAGDSPT